MISFRVREYPDATFVDVVGVLDLKAAPVLGPALEVLSRSDGPGPVVLDLSGVALIDAQNAGLLTTACRAAAARDLRIRAYGAEGRVLRLLEIVGVDKELGLLDPGPLPATPREAVADRTVELLLRARGRAEPAAGDQLRRLAIEAAQGLAYGLARRYRGRGEAAEDLNQVALVGLVNSVDRYDPERGSTFATFAVPTIIGELKRHFRDKGWQIRVPRRLQEVQLEIARTTDELVQRLGRSPTIDELADHVGAGADEILEAYEAARAYRPDSLSTPVADDSDEALGDRLGAVDPEYELVDFRESVAPLLANLPPRQQRVISLRFYGNLTQSEIAAKVGVSQMQVSRLLSDAFRRLRAELGG